jgi:hypothetical protein
MAYVDPMKPDPREAKLPLWAKTMLGDLRRRTMNAEKDRDDARLATKPDESDAIMDPYDAIPIGLGSKPKVTFILRRDDAGEPVSTVDVRLSRDYPNSLELLGSSSLNIRPQVTNVIQVWTTRD